MNGAVKKHSERFPLEVAGVDRREPPEQASWGFASLNPSHPQRSRRGSILLVVLVVVSFLTLGAYAFSERMVTESAATAMYGRRVQTRAFADSGVEMVATLLAQPLEETGTNVSSAPALFQHVLVRDAEAPAGRGRFSVVAPDDREPGTIRFGLVDQSSRINVNTLLQGDVDEETARDRLFYLPNMTDDVADAILDWIDEDDLPRQFGAETEYYSGLSPPYEARNGPIDTLDELLQVAGVTPELLYGEDANRNGLLDANENDGEQRLPYDNADGILDRGWSAYLTVHSRETTLRADGTPKINVNGDDLAALYDDLAAEFDEDAARFVVAYRLFGPAGQEEEQLSGGGSAGRGNRGGSSQGGQSGSGNQSGSQQQRESGSSGEARGGLDLGRNPQETVNSLYDLVDVEVEAEIDGSDTTLESPWGDDPAEMQSYLPQLTETLTTADEALEGRINVNRALREVLLGVPGMSEELAEAIAGAQPVGSTGEMLSGGAELHSTTGWLVMEGLIDLEQMRELAPYLTAGGDVYRFQVLGYFEEGGPYTRLEAVVDATEAVPRAVAVRDLTRLGRGYDPSHWQ